MKGLITLLTAILLAAIILPVGLLYTLIGITCFQNQKKVRLNNYLYLVALSIDQMGNVVAAYLFDDTLIRKRKGYRFGNPDETISGVLGKNKNVLRRCGQWLYRLLNRIEKNHCEKAIEQVREINRKF